MIEFKNGNLFQEKAEAYVNSVNCVGVMGRGLALQFKKAFPENFKAYQKACHYKKIRLGNMHVFEKTASDSPHYIINFPTKNHWREKSQLKSIESGLDDLRRVIMERKIQSIAIPPLGAGLGGLDWKKVKPLIKEKLAGLNGVRIVVFEPQEKAKQPQHSDQSIKAKMTNSRAVVIELMNRYLNGGLSPTITLLELHKLLYFMQEAGEPLRLRFSKGHYGPYAENLNHLLHAMESTFIHGYGDGGDTPTKEIELCSGAIQAAETFLQDQQSTQARLSRVSDLVDGFENPTSLELMASVHWVVQKESAKSAQEAEERIHHWNRRKQEYSSRHIHLAFETLQNQHWFSPLSC